MQMQASHQSTPEDIERYLTHLEEGGRSIPPQPACCPCLELLAEHACGSEQRTAGWAAQPNVTSAPEGAYESTLGGTKNMRKRILASLMALILALSLLPAAAFATGETQEPEQEAQIPVSENGTEGGGEDATIPVETGDETDTSDGTETPVITTPTVTPTETTPVETLTPEPTNVTDGEAEINGTQHATLADAITAVTTGQTIVLRKPIDGCEEVTINKDGVTFTINFAGYPLTSASEDWAFQIEAGNVTLMGGTVTAKKYGINVAKGAELTLADMKISTTVTTGGRVLDNYGTTTVESGTYTGVEGAAQSLIYNKGEMTIKGGTFTQGCETRNAVLLHCDTAGAHVAITGGTFINEYGYGIYCSTGASMEFGGTAEVTSYAPALGGNNTTATADFTVTGGSLTSTENAAIFFPSEGNLTITGGKITGLTGIHALMGDINISGGTITGTGNSSGIEEGYPGSGTGPRSNGSALLLVSNYYTTSLKDNGLRVNITDGIFTSAEDAEAIDHMKPQTPKDTEFKVSITGGTFSTEPSADYIPSGYKAKETAAGWEVTAKDGMEANVTAPVGSSHESSATVTGSFSGYEQAGGEAGEGSVEADGGSVTINVQTGKNEESGEAAPNGQVSSTTVTVDKASVSSVASADVDVTLETDVADLEIPSEAWSSMANAANNGDITIAVKENKTEETVTSWTVTAKAGGKDVFTAADATTITVMVTYDFEAENVVVYCTDSGKQEQMKTTWDKNTKTLSWETPHFSTFAPVTYSNGTEASWIGANGQPTTGTLEDALGAVKDAGGEINLLQNATLSAAQYVISKDVTINGNGKQVTVTVKEGAKVGDGPATSSGNIAFNVGSGATFTLNKVNMTITGTQNGVTANGYDGTGFNVSHGAYLKVNNSTITVQNIERATTAGGADQAHFQFDNSQVTFQNIDGNASNGGYWTLDNTDLTIKGCGSYGLSASNVTVKNGSEVDISNVGYSAIIIVNKAGTEGALTVEDGSTITVSSSGSKLPQISNWSHAVGVIDLGHGSGDGTVGSVTNRPAQLRVNDTSSIILNSNNTNANFIYLTNTAEMENSPTATLPTIQVEPGMATDTYTVRFMVDGKVYNLKRLEIGNGSDTFGFPLDPVKAGWTFTGWTYPSGVTVKGQGNSGYTLTGAEAGKTYDFVAQWSYNTPVVPDDNTPSYSGGSSSSETSYSNTIDASDGGSVKVSPRTPSRGETVTITPTPDTGYEVDEVIVTDRNGDEVDVTANRNGTYTFEQPRGRVTIEVTFVRTGGTAGAAPFLDVAEDAWYADAVAYVYDNGLMSGTSTTLFSPNATTTRGMIVTMLYRLEGEPRISSGSAFDDVDAGMYYADAVAWASQNDIVTGYDEATFGPNNAITREQMAAILYRYAQYKGYRTTADADLSGYVDADSVSSYALASLQWANAAGLVSGTSSNTLTPDGSATRAQVATIFMRFMEDVAE